MHGPSRGALARRVGSPKSRIGNGKVHAILSAGASCAARCHGAASWRSASAAAAKIRRKVMIRERRFVKGAEVRATGSDEKPGIEGYGAVFNQEYVLWDSPTFRVVETVKSGTFARAIRENQDVRCLFNHEPDNVL